MNPESIVISFSERPDVALEVLGVARGLADRWGARLASVAIGEDAAARAEEQIACGADLVLLPGPEMTAHEHPGVLLEILHHVVGQLRPSAILIGSTRVGGEITARLAQRLGVASVSECSALEVDEAGDLVVERVVFGGRFVTRRVIRSVPRIAAVQAKRFEAPARQEGRTGETREVPVDVPRPPVTVVGVRRRERGEVDIGKAEVIVTAGRGVRSKEDLGLVGELAHALGGELAGTRPLVEVNWIPRERQVGLSGRTVKPRLYVACGVSGRIEHIAGMRTARTVVAINTDPNAPIHAEADYSVIGDLYELLPALVRASEDARAGRIPTGGGVAP